MIGSDLSKAASLLSNGELVAIPTETVYGLAANALNPEAVVEIYRVKNRPSFNPLILHIGDVSEVDKYASHIPELARTLMRVFWPGSLSILLHKSENVPDLITAGSPKVVLRMPNHSTTLKLLKRLDFPLAAPSANISNTVSPTTAQHVEDGIGKKIPYILEGGTCNIGLESTIIEVQGDTIHILRDGGITREQLSQYGKVIFTQATDKVQSPGQLSKHYSTKKPLYIVDRIEKYLEENPKQKCSALLFQQSEIQCTTYLLSSDYNLGEIANILFAAMRQADADENEIILIEKVREEGIGRAVADRLKRASTTNL